MIRKDSLQFVKATQHFVNATSTKEQYRVSSTAFTRNRKLPFEIVVLCMLKLLRKSLQAELQGLFRDFAGRIKSISASAFVQSRSKLKPELFYALHHVIVSEYYQDNDETVKLYKSMRVLSIDGSTINLPVTPDIVKHYGTFNNQTKSDDVAIGRVSVLYDVLNDFVIDGLLRPFSQGEITLSREHFQYIREGDLIIMDRAYTSFESAFFLQQKGAHFLFRCKEKFSNQVKAFYESGQHETIVDIKAKRNKSFKKLPYKQDSIIKVKLLRIMLDNGETEILMTSLIDGKEFPYSMFKELYFKRWKVETFYNRFKNIISVERFSGTSNQFIQQEFNCALYMSNLQTILTQEAQYEADKKYENRKYEYKINQSVSLGFIRERLLQLFSCKQHSKKILAELKSLLVLHVIPVRPGRKNIRNTNKYRKRTKPTQLNNRRINL